VKPLTLTPLEGLPLFQAGDDLLDPIWKATVSKDITFQDGDILVLAQKIVSKAEGRLVPLSTVEASVKAEQLAKVTEKDPRLVQLILDESNEVLRAQPGLLIVEHRLGFVCANAGIDRSNIETDQDAALLLPKNPDASAKDLRQQFEKKSGARLGVLIIDSHGRAWRQGVLGLAIGLSGMPGLVDLRGQSDLFGRELLVTTIGAADELAAAASLIMGQADESVPAVHARGFPFPLREGNLNELLRPRDKDAFR
jgi:coenzyme F420-0:L-glutamate ligase/coenzyme F420-1:gamma-L-glutamate ligase